MFYKRYMPCVHTNIWIFRAWSEGIQSLRRVLVCFLSGGDAYIFWKFSPYHLKHTASVLWKWASEQQSLFAILRTCLKSKYHRSTGHEDSEEEFGCSSTFSLTSVLDGSVWSTPSRRPPPGKKTYYPLYRRLCETQDQSGRMRKAFLLRHSIPGPSNL
jgi:hypothetical protein